MSYGMVAVPKSMWKLSNYKSRIKHLLYHVSVIEEKLTDLRIDLSGIIEDLETVKVEADLKEELAIIYEEIKFFKENNPKFEDECANMNILQMTDRDNRKATIDIFDISLNKLEQYRQKLNINFGDYERIHAMLDHNIMQVLNLQARINARESLEFRNKNLKGLKKISYFYYVTIHPIFLKFMAVLTALLTCMLLYAEFTNFINIENSLFNWIFEKDLGYFVTYILMFVPLFYMLVCTYYGLFSVKVASWYELYVGHTDPVSMIWSGTIFARLIYPMSYNFISIMKVKNTNYAEVLGILDDFTVLGDGMNSYFFPIVLIIFFLMNLLNLWGRLLNV